MSIWTFPADSFATRLTRYGSTWGMNPGVPFAVAIRSTTGAPGPPALLPASAPHPARPRATRATAAARRARRVFLMAASCPSVCSLAGYRLQAHRGVPLIVPPGVRDSPRAGIRGRPVPGFGHGPGSFPFQPPRPHRPARDVACRLRLRAAVAVHRPVTPRSNVRRDLVAGRSYRTGRGMGGD